MRKTVIALMLILPLLFVFVIFSSVNIASLGVNIAAGGIQILNKGEFDGMVRLDLADKSSPKLEVEVTPGNASNRNYTYEVSEVEGSRMADVYVDADGYITALSEGSAVISAVSNDGGFRDSINVIVSSSKPYAFDFKLFDSYGDEVKLVSDDKVNYTASVKTGSFFYSASILPSTFTSYTIEGDVVVDRAARSLLIPFSGQRTFKVAVPNAVGILEKNITLNVERQGNLSINGSDRGAAISVDKEAKKVSFYVESDVRPIVRNMHENHGNIGYGIVEDKVEIEEKGKNCYFITAPLTEGAKQDFDVEVAAGDIVSELKISFSEFDFTISTDMVSDEDGVVMLNGKSQLCYIAATVASDYITYKWGLVNEFNATVGLVAENGSIVEITPLNNGDFTVWVEAYRNGFPTGNYKELNITVMPEVSGLVIAGDELPTSSLVDKLTIGGYRYDENGNEKKCDYELGLKVSFANTPSVTSDIIDEGLEWSISDRSKATLILSDGKLLLHPIGTGEVTVTVSWKGNKAFNENKSVARTFNVVNNGIMVYNAPEFMKATESGRETILFADIMLGTNEKGEVLPESERIAYLATHKHKSTYNIDWYKNNDNEKAAQLMHIVEFTEDVYGNGHNVNAEYYAAVKDGASGGFKEGFFKGPLDFVRYGEIASVAGQDNCAFLIRRDGVKLYGVNLSGCLDSSLLEGGMYELNKLNFVGTVLEINADNVSIINCRLNNGRNVVRVYGGNRDGNSYFIDSLKGFNGCDNERINVTFNGCILARAREFILKVGANKALRASSKVSGEVQPYLLDSDGNPYRNNYNNLGDNYFYKQYVLTDVTVKDSVFETSGLFSIGVETNFSGAMLYSGSETTGLWDSWIGTGGTSFASVVRLNGDVRMYDWKDLSYVDSSTLINVISNGSLGDKLAFLKLNISSMINYVQSLTAEYSDILTIKGGKQYVHGGMAFYGGGRNYSVMVNELNETASNGLKEYFINIDILKNAQDPVLQGQGTNLPNAAGTQDFRFYMYNSGSVNSYEKQLDDEKKGNKYSGIKRVPAFEKSIENQ